MELNNIENFETHQNYANHKCRAVLTVNTIMENICIYIIIFILFVYLSLFGRIASITTDKDVSTQTEEIFANNDALVDEEPEEQRHILAYIFSSKIRI